jgi:hypothetical protein
MKKPKNRRPPCVIWQGKLPRMPPEHDGRTYADDVRIVAHDNGKGEYTLVFERLSIDAMGESAWANIGWYSAADVEERKQLADLALLTLAGLA